MAEQSSSAADAAVAGTTAAVGTTVVAQGSTPSPGTGDPVVGGGESVAALKERLAFLEKEAKAAYEARDKAKQRFLESDEGKAIAAKAAKADEYEKARALADEQAAKDRGEWKRLHDEKEAALIKEREERANAERMHREVMAKREIKAVLREVKAKDLDILQPIIDRALADGSIKVADDGEVVGVPDVVRKLVEAKPYLFDTGAGDALKRLGVTPGSLSEGAAAAHDQKIATTEKPVGAGCLALPSLPPDFAKRFAWRDHLKPKQ